MAMYQVIIKKIFPAAHSLAEKMGGQEKLHGHNFTAEFKFSSEQGNDPGFAIDFAALTKWMDIAINQLDHYSFNDDTFFKSKNPSAENIAIFLQERISRQLNGSTYLLSNVSVWETDQEGASYITGR